MKEFTFATTNTITIFQHEQQKVFPTVLQEVTVEAVPHDTCVAKYAAVGLGSQVNQDVMLCAGVPQGGKGSCQGDSGGPLIDRFGNQGIVHDYSSVP